MHHRFTKLEAAVHLGVSPTTISRMIQRGELQVEREGPGDRAKVWVLIEDSSNGLSSGSPSGIPDVPDIPTGSPSDVPDIPTGSPSDVPDIPTGSPSDVPDVPAGSPTDVPDVPTGSPSDVPDVPAGSPAGTAADLELAVLQERVKHLEQLAEERGERLKDSEWRYHELVKEFANTVATLTRALPAPEDTRQATTKRSWWPFHRRSAA